jgi:hypothetical protein
LIACLGKPLWLDNLQCGGHWAHRTDAIIQPELLDLVGYINKLQLLPVWCAGQLPEKGSFSRRDYVCSLFPRLVETLLCLVLQPKMLMLIANKHSDLFYAKHSLRPLRTRRKVQRQDTLLEVAVMAVGMDDSMS